MSMHALKAQAWEEVDVRHPGPWHVGDRPSERSMFPIRDAHGKPVAFVRLREVALFIAHLYNESAPEVDRH